MGKLDGKIAIITGGSGGIGKAAAQVFTGEGAQVMLVDLDGDVVGEGVERAPGGQCIGEGAHVGGFAGDREIEVVDRHGDIVGRARAGRAVGGRSGAPNDTASVSPLSGLRPHSPRAAVEGHGRFRYAAPGL